MKLFSKKTGIIKIENVEHELKVIDQSLKKLMQELMDVQHDLSQLRKKLKHR